MFRPLLSSDLLVDADLGVATVGAQRVAARALVDTRDDTPELFLEFTVSGGGADAVNGVHVPATGVPALRRLAQALVDGEPLDPPSPREQRVAPVLQALDTVQTHMGTVAKVAFGVVLASLLLSYLPGRPAWLTLQPLVVVLLPVTLLGFFALFLGNVVGARLLARAFGEAPALGHVRLVHGPVRRPEPLGAWQASKWPTAARAGVLDVQQVACLTATTPPRLVLATTRQTATDRGSEVFALDANQASALLTALDRLAALRDTAA